MFDLRKLLVDVFEPQAGERVLVVVDEPSGSVPDHEEWRARREMAEEWRDAFASLAQERGFEVEPLLTFPATGANNADLPGTATRDGDEVPLQETLLDATLVVAMTQFSATAPLAHLAEQKEDFRAASMPGVLKRMERTALSADYAEVARRCRAIDELMRPAHLCDVTFSTGHRCWFDLRDRHSEVDDGHLPRFKPGDRIINLPSGETFKVPYEGEKDGQPSWTAGSIPVASDEEVIVFHVSGNRVREVEGTGSAAEFYRKHFAEDPARANVAEVAFGVNDRAEIQGSVIEDEKAGFHWAFGRSDHLGGVVGVSRFRAPETVVHQDIVYAGGSPIQVVRATLIDAEGRAGDVIRDGRYLL
jgi:leucyl aminopeptidase (aminopeptidase T)